MKFPVYNHQGEQIKDIELPVRLFGRAVNSAVVHQVVVAQEANSREVLAHTKTRAEVRGGGKKPWRQKGTGRARHGSSRSPIWVGGGITFGPRNDRNFTQKVNKKMKQAALAMCLSDKAANKGLFIFDKLENPAGKTKDLNAWFGALKKTVAGLKENKKFLLVMNKPDDKLTRAAKNLKGVATISAKSLNCVDLLKTDALLVSVQSVEEIEKTYKQVKNQVKEKAATEVAKVRKTKAAKTKTK
ncbi:MAG: 50S ribosomal protein L4 [Candidatus Buchananbacteria bacterium]